MPASETDLELLETYLDGELPVADAEGLWRRLAIEPALAEALDGLRADRAARQAVWAGMEPRDVAAGAVVRRVASSVRRRGVLELVARGLKVAVAAAACVVFGFGVGWLGRGNYPPSGRVGPQDVRDVSLPRNIRPADSARHTFPVAIRDGSGKVVSVEQFDSLQDANDFINDLNKWQVRRQQAHDTPVVPVSDEQF